MPDTPSIMLKQFMEGCRTGNVSVITACLADSNFDPNELTDSRRSNWPDGLFMSSRFIEACYYGHTEIVRILLKDSRINIHKIMSRHLDSLNAAKGTQGFSATVLGHVRKVVYQRMANEPDRKQS